MLKLSSSSHSLLCTPDITSNIQLYSLRFSLDLAWHIPETICNFLEAKFCGCFECVNPNWVRSGFRLWQRFQPSKANNIIHQTQSSFLTGDLWVLEICYQLTPKLLTQYPGGGHCHTPPASQNLMVMMELFVSAGWNSNMEDSWCTRAPILFAVHYTREHSKRKSATWHGVIEFSALSDCITNTAHIETLWQLPSAHSEEPEPLDLKHLIKAWAGLSPWGKKQETTGLILLYNSFK